VTPNLFIPVRLSLPQQKPTGEDEILKKTQCTNNPREAAVTNTGFHKGNLSGK